MTGNVNLDVKSCIKCGATWVEGQLFWSTGKEGDPHDLAGLVCNKYGNDDCINPCRGSDSGQTWEMRRKLLDGMMEGLEEDK
tara:strand:+ start:2492 stop:2737 length:246 start_codon:yes stop_codon:yes gene_type:complete